MNDGLPPNRMSVPLPAIFVAIVTAPNLPAWAIISASFSWNLAFKTSWAIPSSVKILESNSDFSIDTVPTRTGWFLSCLSFISLATALNLANWLAYTESARSFLNNGLLVGTWNTSILYIDLNSSSSVLAVPVIPDNFVYILK